jgi:hypothetical protein
MSDQFTEVTTQGYFSRLGGSIIGVLIGILMVPGSIFLLYWNEGRAVDAIVALDQGAKQVVETSATAANDSANGKLVHLTGELTAQNPARDPVFGVTGNGAIRLKRDVEMYQWREETHSETHENVGGSKTTETSYTYQRIWSTTPISSGSFKHPEGHNNPPMSMQGQTFDGGEVKLGIYRLTPRLLEEVAAFAPLDAGSANAPEGYRRDGAGLYHGNDPGSPVVGDLRISFESVQPQTYSMVAALASGSLAEYRGTRDYTIALAAPGAVSAEQLFKAKKAAESTLTWILRGVGFVVMLIGFLLVARPFSMILAFLPFLEGIAETGAFLIAVMMTIPLTLLVIAIAWVVHRPLIGGVMILLAIGAFVLFGRMRTRRVAAVAK